jgi:hypothetical protein
MRLRTLACPALLLAGCGQVTSPGQDGSVGTEIDASVGGGDPDAAPEEPDASVPPVQGCTWSVPTDADFVNVNGPDLEQSPSFTGDGRTIFFTVMPADESVPPDVWDAVREEAGQPFGAARLVGEVSSAMGESEVEIAPADDEIVFVRDGGAGILTAARLEKGPFGKVEDTGLVGSSPTLSGDGLDIYFLDRANGSILHASRPSREDGFDSVEAVGGAGPYAWIDVSANELRMLLSGPEDAETPAIAIAERSSVDEDFGEPVPAGPSIGEGGFPIPREARWDGSGTQLVVSARRVDGNADLFFSRCE